jgi:cytochrome c biogenesis protein CcmG, thiol:disulfide interchange protein DsbE
MDKGAASPERRIFLMSLAAGALVGLLTGSFIPAGALGAGQEILKTGEPLPSFILPDLNGTKVNVPGDFRGRVAVIHFWASWCSCAEELGDLETLYKTYKEKGFTGIAVNVGQTKDAAVPYVLSLNLSYPVLLDSELKVSRRYGIQSIPRTFIIDRRGILRYKIIGQNDGEGLKKLAMPLL